jgi:hypothetical protein
MANPNAMKTIGFCTVRAQSHNRGARDQRVRGEQREPRARVSTDRQPFG